MNCDDYLPALATGGPLRRWQAARHAAHCPHCAATGAHFEVAKHAWSQPDELSNAQRAIWQSVVRHSVIWQTAMTSPARLQRRIAQPIPAAIALAACLLVAVFVVLRGTSERPDGTSVELHASRSTAPVVTESVQIAGIERSLDRLANELEELKRLAELADVRREADQLSAKYPRLSGESQSHN